MSKPFTICCPKCSWKPDGGAHWACTCGHVWNTFDTAGQCPACAVQWEVTQCITHAGGCGRMSAHLAWYKELEKWADALLTWARKQPGVRKPVPEDVN